MKKKWLYRFLFALLVVLSFSAGHLYRSFDSSSAENKGRRILYYVDPMNPSHTSDKPGVAPCGMNMEPVYESDASSNNTSSTLSPGIVKISPEKQQMIGVRTGIVESGPVKHVIRTTGRIAPDEKRVYRLIAGTDGWIREAYDNDTGTLVRKDQKLASFYSPQFWSAQVSYISLYGSKDDYFIQPAGKRALAPSQQASISHQTYLDALEGLGMSEQQIRELAETKKLTDKVYIVSPVTGFILSRDISPGQRFDKGTEWYKIADLSRVWVVADLFQNDADYVKPGTLAKVSLPQRGKEYQALVSKVLPQFDTASRTLKVRLEIDNPGFILKPDMFVDVEFPVTFSETLSVPSEAVLHSGQRKIVFVDRGAGIFEPRQVETGWQSQDRIQITRGLMQGEHIVVSGNFLIDSESKMKMAASGMLSKNGEQRVIDPVCGMDVVPGIAKTSGLFAEHDGKTHYFCTPVCKEDFLKHPERFAKGPQDASSLRDIGQPSKPERLTLSGAKKISLKDSNSRQAMEHLQ